MPEPDTKRDTEEDRPVTDDLTATTMTFRGHDGDDVQGYLARPMTEGSRAGVVVIHHMPGWDRWSKEVTRRFATMGYDALCPNLYWREAPGSTPEEASSVARERGGVPDERLVGDVGGGVSHLRGLDSSNGRVGVIGYCSGGRHSVLAACNLDLDAAVDCYGAFVTGEPPEGWPVPISNLVDQLPRLACPLLGLFGQEDSFPSPEQVDELDRILSDHGKDHEFHRYEGAGHAFFCVDRPAAFRSEAAVDGWSRIEAFFARHLGAGG